LLRRTLLQHARSAVAIVLMWLHSMQAQPSAAPDLLLGCQARRSWVQKLALYWAPGDLALHFDGVLARLAAERMRWVMARLAQARCQDLLAGLPWASAQQVSRARPQAMLAAAVEAPALHPLPAAQLCPPPPLPAVLQQAPPLGPLQRLQRAHCRPVPGSESHAPCSALASHFPHDTCQEKGCNFSQSKGKVSFSQWCNRQSCQTLSARLSMAAARSTASALLSGCSRTAYSRSAIAPMWSPCSARAAARRWYACRDTKMTRQHDMVSARQTASRAASWLPRYTVRMQTRTAWGHMTAHLNVIGLQVNC
jgi:hypothetical protein